MKADHYDSFAESYSTDNESSLFNAHYERPAMVELARRRLGENADLHVADLSQPLPFAAVTRFSEEYTRTHRVSFSRRTSPTGRRFCASCSSSSTQSEFARAAVSQARG